MNDFADHIRKHTPHILKVPYRALRRAYNNSDTIFYINIYWRRLFNNKVQKYFCIGRNKTGTTSISKAFINLGFKVGDQRRAEILHSKYYFQKRFSKFYNYCYSADVFQDVPFSCPETFKYLDKKFPNSKFILTIRDDSEQWYNSLIRSHSKMLRNDGKIPTASDLKHASYVAKGRIFNTMELYGTSAEDPYNKDILIAHYNRHNRDVISYFRDRPEDLLVINLSERESYRKFIDFLGVDSAYDEFPWENRT